MSILEALDEGVVTFLGVELLVGRGALVPREETELLGRTALAAIRALDVREPRVIDLCCGVGNLACAIAARVPTAKVWAADLTDECVDLARRNVAYRELDERVSVHQGDLFAAFDGLGLEGSIDVIVCNPPYISEKRLSDDRAHLLTHEPREAFAAGPYGIAIHQRVVKEALRFLRPGGELLFEIGLGQERQVEMLFARAKSYGEVHGVTNGAGEVRVLHATRKAE